jgi:hypothetical protein
MSDIDWSKATFDGARREQLRRWSMLSLREIIQALEEMQQLAIQLGNKDALTPAPDRQDTDE